MFGTNRLARSLRDLLFPVGTRRRAVQRWLRLRIAGTTLGPRLLGDNGADSPVTTRREYESYLRRTVVPEVGGSSAPPRVVTLDDLGPPERLRALLDDLQDDEVVVLLQQKTVLHPEARAHLMAAVEAGKADAAYVDLDHLDEHGARVRPWFKPDWSPDLVLSVDLLGPVAAVRGRHLKSLVLTGLPRGLWLWRLALQLRAADATVAHVPHVLAHIKTQASADGDSVVPMIEAALGREGRRDVSVSVTDRLKVTWRPSPELVSIIIPTRDKADILAVCLQTLLERTAYRPFEVILVDTGSEEEATQRLYATHRDRSGFSILTDSGPFNFSRACNTGARAALGSRFLFLNNDTEILHPDWLDRMAQWLEDPRVGAVGARLIYPDGTLQHAGVVVGMGGLASHLFHEQRKGVTGVFGPEHWYRNLSAVTAACLLTSRSAFELIGGFDEGLKLVYGDTDFCLRLRRIGLRIVYSPDAELVHHEKQSRGKSVPRADFVRFSESLHAMGTLDGDPYFNPALSYESTRPRLAGGAGEDPKHLNRTFMAALPQKANLVFPDDLL